MNPWLAFLLGVILATPITLLFFSVFASGTQAEREWHAFRRGYQTGQLDKCRGKR